MQTIIGQEGFRDVQSLSEIKQQLAAMVESTLGPLGFVVPKGGSTWHRKRCEDFLDVVVVNTLEDAPGEPVRGNVRLSIHCEKLERLTSAVTGQKYTLIRPTFTTYISYVMPEKIFRSWHFDREQEHFDAETARSLCQAIIEYGFPWFQQYTSLESLRSGIQQYGLRRDVAFALILLEETLGNRASAVSLARAEIAKLESRPALGAGERQELEHLKKALDYLRGREQA